MLDGLINAAARLVVEEGLEYSQAKRRALQQLELPSRTPLPDNAALEAAVREYIAIFCADTQARELAALRAIAWQWMARLDEFRPHLTGAVWLGTATRRNDILLQLFCDDPKSAEIALINQDLTYDTGQTQGFNGRLVDVLTITERIRDRSNPLAANPASGVSVRLLIYDLDDLKGALKPDASGRISRGNAEAVGRLLRMSD